MHGIDVYVKNEDGHHDHNDCNDDDDYGDYGDSSFIPRTCNLWNVLPAYCFPESYNLTSQLNIPS